MTHKKNSPKLILYFIFSISIPSTNPCTQNTLCSHQLPSHIHHPTFTPPRSRPPLHCPFIFPPPLRFIFYFIIIIIKNTGRGSPLQFFAAFACAKHPALRTPYAPTNSPRRLPTPSRAHTHFLPHGTGSGLRGGP